MEFPVLDQWGRPLEKLPNCPRCGEDELGVVTEELLLCYKCSFRVEKEIPTSEREAYHRSLDQAVRDALLSAALREAAPPATPGVVGLSGVSAAPVPALAPRSPDWARVREEFVKNNPECACCGRTSGLEVHHLKPFHLFPESELDPKNLITLCRSGPGGLNCHLLVGHCGDWKDYNPSAVLSAAYFARMLKNKKEG